MTRTKLLSILQVETDCFKEQSRLRDDVLDAMERAYVKGKNEQLIIPVVSNRRELFPKPLPHMKGHKPECKCKPCQLLKNIFGNCG